MVNLSTLIEGPLEYDTIGGQIVNSDRAGRLVHREYRKGWTLDIEFRSLNYMHFKHKMSRLMALSAGASVLIAAPFVKAQNLTLWYSQPANKGMNEALPIGEGKFSGLVYGNPKQERVVLNEISLWTGSELSSDNYDKMGSYQMLGELLVDMGAGQEAVAGAELYRRGLDLETAVHSVTYRADGVVHRREAFASHADGVMVFRFSSDRHSACNGRLKGAHKENKTATGNRLVFPARWITG